LKFSVFSNQCEAWGYRRDLGPVISRSALLIDRVPDNPAGCRKLKTKNRRYSNHAFATAFFAALFFPAFFFEAFFLEAFFFAAFFFAAFFFELLFLPAFSTS